MAKTRFLRAVIALAVVALLFWAWHRAANERGGAGSRADAQFVESNAAPRMAAASAPREEGAKSTAPGEADNIPTAPVIDQTAPRVSSYRDAADLALEETDPITRSMAFGKLFTEWRSADFDAAFAYLESMPRVSEFTSALVDALRDLAARDVTQALARAATLATNAEQRVVYSVLFNTFATQDLHRATGLLDLVQETKARDAAIRAVMSRWADRDVNGALAQAQALELRDDRDAAIETALFTLSVQDPWRALDVAAKELDGAALERSVSHVMRRLGEVEPEQAARIVNLLPSGETQAHIAFDLARALAAVDPRATVKWIEMLPTREMSQQALHNVLDLWSATAPDEATLYVGAMPRGENQDHAAEHLAVLLAEKSPVAAERWADSLSSASAKQSALVGVANGWARHDAPAAARWAVTLPMNSPARNEAIYSAISYWVLTDAASATAFAQALSPQSARAAALRALAVPEE